MKVRLPKGMGGGPQDINAMGEGCSCSGAFSVISISNRRPVTAAAASAISFFAPSVDIMFFPRKSVYTFSFPPCTTMRERERKEYRFLCPCSASSSSADRLNSSAFASGCAAGVSAEGEAGGSEVGGGGTDEMCIRDSLCTQQCVGEFAHLALVHLEHMIGQPQRALAPDAGHRCERCV